jgi:hypothetical protein
MQLWLPLSLVGFCAMTAAQNSSIVNILHRAFVLAGGKAGAPVSQNSGLLRCSKRLGSIASVLLLATGSALAQHKGGEATCPASTSWE